MHLIYSHGVLRHERNMYGVSKSDPSHAFITESELGQSGSCGSCWSRWRV